MLQSAPKPRINPRLMAIKPIEIPEEKSENLTAMINNTEDLQDDKEGEYIPPIPCRSLVSPSNSQIKLSKNLRSAVNIFTNKSNDARTRLENQRLVERALVERGSCSNVNPSIMKDMRVRLFTLDHDTLESVLDSEESLNANIHDNIACTIDAIIYDGKQPGTFTPSQRERIRSWFKSIKKIGDSSVEGHALQTSFTDDTNMFVMKVPQNPENDELAHEALVGLYGLNKLRHILPNFMYIYGYAKCSPPFLDHNEILTWCSSSNPPVSYLIMENIRDSVPMREFVRDPNVTALDVLVVWNQIENALNLAHKKYGYTHYDLHYGNILVRKYRNLVAIPFLGKRNEVIGYIVTKYVPYIIDYGYSRIKVGGIGFGKIGLEVAGIDGQRSFPMYDTYKLLGFLGESIYSAKTQGQHYFAITELIEKLFSYFNEGSLIERVRKRVTSKNDWYQVPDKYLNITHDDYIDWMRQGSGIIDPVITDIAGLVAQNIYPAPINVSVDVCDFYDLVASDKGPDSSLEYCEVVAAINADNTFTPEIKLSAITWLNSRFNADDYFKRTFGDINKQIREGITLRSRLDNIPVISENVDLESGEFIYKYRTKLKDLLRLKEITSNIISYIKASICSLSNQDTYTLHKDKIERLDKFTTQWTILINSQRKVVKQNVKFVSRYDLSTLRKYSDAQEFWTTGHKSLASAL